MDVLARMLLTSISVLGLGAAGCVSPPPADPAASTEADDDRRERLRSDLREALGNRYDESLPVVTPAQVERGGKVYDLLCRSCHGPTGRGTGRAARSLAVKPPDLGDPQAAGFFSDRAKLEIIASGAPGTPMIGWSGMLEEADQLAVLAFMNTLVVEEEGP